MKHKITLLATVLFTALLSSAFTVKNLQSNTLITTSPVVKSVVGGDWIISTYYDGKTDQTATVSAYSFTFNGDGSIAIFHGGAFGAPGQYSNNGTIMSLYFNQDDLSQLNGDWKIVSQNDNAIQLMQGSRELDFVKNPNAGNPSDLQ